MNSIDAPQPRHDLGVLFVHGIGQSKQGETLLSFGEPLRAAIELLAEPARSEAPVTINVSAAWLSEPGEDAPARAELSIDGARCEGSNAERASRWLLAEAWWAEKFPTPTYGDIASWSFGALPVVLVSHFDRRFRRAGFGLVRVLRGDMTLIPTATALVRLVVEGLVLTATLAATPILLLMIALLLVLGLPPFKATRELAGSLQRTIAATVGDSFVFMRQAMTAATITSAVRDRLEWLSSRCRRVAVVAHSQGAAVAHRVLRGAATAPCDLFITYGSGLGKLSDMERGDIARGSRYLWLAAGAGVIVLMGALGLLVRGWNQSVSPYGLILPVFRIFFIVEAGALAVFFVMSRVAFADDTPAPQPAGGSAAPPTLPVSPNPGAGSGGGTGSGVGPSLMTIIGWPAAFAGTVGAFSALLDYRSQPAAGGHWAIDVILSFLIAGGLAIAFSAAAAWRSQSLRTMDPKLQWLRDRELFASDYALPNRDRLWWHDLYSTADPVSNGRLLDEFDAPRLISTPVSNEHSVVFDHTTYWKATDDFVQRVARLLLDEAALGVRTVKSWRAASRRRWRVKVLTTARRTLALEAAALALLWAGQTPDWVRTAFGALNTTPKADAGWWATWSHEWLERLYPGLAGAAVGALAWWVLKRIWSAWNRREIELFWQVIDYEAFPAGLLLVLALPLAGALAVAYAASDWIGMLVVVLVALGTVVGLRCWKWAMASHQLASRSGTGAQLDALETRRLTRKLEVELARRDEGMVTATAKLLEGFDADRARDGLAKAAFELKSPNAALALGRMLESDADRTSDAAQMQTLLDKALAAFRQGASLGDPVSAWHAAQQLQRRGDPVGAMEMFRQAHSNGDATSAHSIGLALMNAARKDRSKRDEASAFYEEGMRRGDPLSALFLAGHYEALASELSGEESLAHKRMAVAQYRVAFDLGEVSAAEYAGRLLRDLGDIPAAKRALTLGMRLRHARAALTLGHLERDDEQDVEAARRAYREAIYLDDTGYEAGEALLALGQMLEAQQREKAAVLRYEEVLRISGVDRSTQAKAGLRLAALLEKANRWTHAAKISATLRVAARRSPSLAGDAYIEHLVKNYDREGVDALVEDDLATMTAAGLFALAQFIRSSDQERYQALLKRAFGLGPYGRGSSEATVALIESLEADSPELEPLLKQVASRDAFEAGRVAKLLEENYRPTLAERLNKLTEAIKASASAVDAPGPP